MKRIFIPIALVLAVGLGIVTTGFMGSDGDAAGTAQALEPIEVTRGNLVITVEGTGSIEPKFEIEVKSRASGAVLRVAGEEGDKVSKEDVLVELDPRDEQRTLEIRQAELARAEAALAKSEAALALTKVDTAVALANAHAHLEAAHADLKSSRNRLGRLLKLAEEQDLASPEEVDQASTEEAKALARLREAEQSLLAAQAGPLQVEQRRRDVDLAKVDLKKARIAEQVQEDRLRDTHILAPMDGVIVTKLVERGQIIASGISSASGGTPLLNLADTSQLFVSAEIDESDIGKVQDGQAVSISVDAHEHQAFEGRVVRVAPRGEESQNVTIFRVKIEVTDPRREQLLLGMTAQVHVVVASVENAVLVPNTALKMNGDQLGVLLPPETEGGEPRFQPVRRGRTDGVVTEVLDGLTGGESVLVRGDLLGSGSGGRSGFNRNVRRAMWYMRR